MTDEFDETLDSENEEQAAKPKRENSTIRQMRETIEARDAELKAFRERTAKYEDAFLANSGLTEKQAAVFRKAYDEVTPENLEAFRTEVLGAATEQAEASEDDEVDTNENEMEEMSFQPTRVAGTRPGSREYTSNEIVALMKTDKAKADKLLREGKVKRSNFHPGGPAF